MVEDLFSVARREVPEQSAAVAEAVGGSVGVHVQHARDVVGQGMRTSKESRQPPAPPQVEEPQRM